MNEVKKTVKFDDSKNTYFTTYSSDDYDRYQIDSVLYRKAHNKISVNEWLNILLELNEYKCSEMIVHKLSIKNLYLENC